MMCLCTSGFMADAIFAQSKLLDVAPPAEAQCTRSLRLGYKLCAVIPVAGKVTSQVATQGAESAVYDCLVIIVGYIQVTVLHWRPTDRCLQHALRSKSHSGPNNNIPCFCENRSKSGASNVTIRYIAPETSFKLQVANHRWTATNDIDCSQSKLRRHSQPQQQQKQHQWL